MQPNQAKEVRMDVTSALLLAHLSDTYATLFFENGEIKLYTPDKQFKVALYKKELTTAILPLATDELLLGQADGRHSLLKVASNQLHYKENIFQETPNYLHAIATFFQDANKLYTVSYIGLIRVYDLTTKQLITRC